jgi:hypothetical protein
LSTRTYIVGEHVTVADICIYSAYRCATQIGAIENSLLPSIFRWYMTVGALPAVLSVVGDAGSLLATVSVVKPGAGGKKSGEKWDRHRIRVKELLAQGESVIGKEVVLKGWIRTTRSAEKGAVLFVELTDGSTVRGIQLVFNASSIGMRDVEGAGGAGASISVTGVVVPSPAKGQSIEVHIKEGKVIGPVFGGDKGEIGGKNYPMAKKQHTLEFLREKAHLRPRSKVFSSALRVRNAMAFATHKVFLNIKTLRSDLIDLIFFVHEHSSLTSAGLFMFIPLLSLLLIVKVPESSLLLLP